MIFNTEHTVLNSVLKHVRQRKRQLSLYNSKTGETFSGYGCMTCLLVCVRNGMDNRGLLVFRNESEADMQNNRHILRETESMQNFAQVK